MRDSIKNIVLKSRVLYYQKILGIIPVLLYSKTGVYRGITIFLIFDPKHRLWVLVRTTSPRRFLTYSHNQCFEQTYLEYHFFTIKFSIFTAKKSLFCKGNFS